MSFSWIDGNLNNSVASSLRHHMISSEIDEEFNIQCYNKLQNRASAEKYKMVCIHVRSWSLTNSSQSSTTLESHHWILSKFLRNFITGQLDRAVALVLDFCFSRSTFRPFLRLLNNGYNDLLFWSHYFYFPHQVPTPQCRTCIVPRMRRRLLLEELICGKRQKYLQEENKMLQRFH